MQWFKFSLIVLLVLPSVSEAGKFVSGDCLTSSFEAQVKSEGRFFGLLKNNLKLKKTKCLIEVTFKGILETQWSVDICREPVHMKVKSKGSQSVYKRKSECSKDDKSDFCYFRNELIANLQDQGLIFADGEKEKLSDAHGQIYCSYLLLGKYLDKGELFSQYNTDIDLYTNNSACSIPENKSEEEDKEVKEVKEVINKVETEKPMEATKEFDKPMTPAIEESEEAEKPRF